LQIWDFSYANVEHWRNREGLRAYQVPAYVPRRVRAAASDPSRQLMAANATPIDILFYGLRNDRREAMQSR
jgi:hypothetical protein